MLDDDDTALAALNGWRVCICVDEKTGKVFHDISPSTNDERWSRAALLNKISTMARTGNSTAVATLKLLTTPVPKKGKR